MLNHAPARTSSAGCRPAFFAVRYVIYGVDLHRRSPAYFAKKSREQDETGDPKISETLRIASAPAMILYALATCCVAFDILMSIAPKWYSTIYGVNFWGSALRRRLRGARADRPRDPAHRPPRPTRSTRSTTTTSASGCSRSRSSGRTPRSRSSCCSGTATCRRRRVWYKYRMFGEWQWVSIAMLVGFWAFPFVFLLSRWTKRIVPSLVFFAVWQLVFHWLDLYWNVMPSYDWQVDVPRGRARSSRARSWATPRTTTSGSRPSTSPCGSASSACFIAGIGRTSRAT